MKQATPQKETFFDLLNRAVRTTDKAGLEKQESQPTSDYSYKKTHQHKIGGALKKQSDKSRG